MIYVEIALALALAFYFIVRPIRKRVRRMRLRTAPFPSEWQAILDRRLPIQAHLPPLLQEQLKGTIQIFLAEKSFVGCKGVEITDEIRVTIASQASLLLLGRKTTYYPNLYTIYVYPSAYRATESVRTGHGVEGERPSVRLGESWTRGSVVLSWDHSRHGAANFADGQNVVIHEFSHQLDQEDGASDGAPILESRSSTRTWAQVLGAEYAKLKEGAQRGEFSSLIQRYGATNPAEFFAVVSETFFEKPAELRRKHPELYEELASYYKVDPVEWR